MRTRGAATKSLANRLRALRDRNAGNDAPGHSPETGGVNGGDGTAGVLAMAEEFFGGARFRVTIDGEAFEAPYDTDFSDLTGEEVKLAVPFAAGDPVRLAAAFLFVKLRRHIPALEPGDLEGFHAQIAPMFAGDTSIVEVAGG